jgi:hypothetical protein
MKPAVMDLAPISFTRELAQEVVSPGNSSDLAAKGYTKGPEAQAALPQTVIHNSEVGAGHGKSAANAARPVN